MTFSALRRRARSFAPLTWFIAGLLFAGAEAGAQTSADDEARRENLELTESGAAYLREMRGTGVEAEVGYFDPTRPPPELKLTVEVEPPAPEEETEPTATGDGQAISLIVTILILVAIGFLIARFGGATALSVRSAPGEGARAAGDADAGGLTNLDGADVGGVADIAAIKDRRLALIALLRQVFRRAASDNGMRLERSWTAREALRRIPPSWRHLDMLTALTRDAELAHFGGREVEEAAFQAHLQAARPLLRAGA